MTDLNSIPVSHYLCWLVIQLITIYSQELAGGPFKIVCQEDTAKNFPQIPGQPPFFTKIPVDGPHPGKYEEVGLIMPFSIIFCPSL